MSLVDKLVSLLKVGSKWQVTRTERGVGGEDVTVRTVTGVYNTGEWDRRIVWNYGDPLVSYNSALPDEQEIITVTPELIHWQYDWGEGLELTCVPLDSQRTMF